MLEVDTIIMFLSASIVLALIPGPDNLFVLTHSALHGFTSGIATTLGLCTGVLVHTMGVALGISIIFETSQEAFNILKIIGALYLLYLAWQAFRASATRLAMKNRPRLSLKKLYLRGIFMNLTNPKVVIFFLAFLPQFTNPENGSITLQIITLGILFNIAAFFIFVLIAFFAGYAGEWLKGSSKAQIILNRIAGVIFVSFALKLLITQA